MIVTYLRECGQVIVTYLRECGQVIVTYLRECGAGDCDLPEGVWGR